MAVRFYLVPVETVTDVKGRTVRRPKYATALSLSPIRVLHYGNEPVCLLAADVTTPQHTSLAANADVSAFPVNLELEVGANVTTVQAELEARGIPGDMVTSTINYRQVLRGIIAVFSISASTPLFGPGVTLDTTIGELSPGVRAELKASAESSRYNYNGITAGSTIREALRTAIVTSEPRTVLGVEL